MPSITVLKSPVPGLPWRELERRHGERAQCFELALPHEFDMRVRSSSRDIWYISHGPYLQSCTVDLPRAGCAEEAQGQAASEIAKRAREAGDKWGLEIAAFLEGRAGRGKS